MQSDGDDLTLIASAARARIEEHRLNRERDAALARVNAHRNLTAAFNFDKNFLSAKAKLQPRDMKGRWIDMGATVRWLEGHRIGGNEKWKRGKVLGFDAKAKKYTISPEGGGPDVRLDGKQLEVVKAAIPDSPDEARKLEHDVAVPDDPRGDLSQPPKTLGEKMAREKAERQARVDAHNAKASDRAAEQMANVYRRQDKNWNSYRDSLHGKSNPDADKVEVNVSDAEKDAAFGTPAGKGPSAPDAGQVSASDVKRFDRITTKDGESGQVVSIMKGAGNDPEAINFMVKLDSGGTKNIDYKPDEKVDPAGDAPEAPAAADPRAELAKRAGLSDEEMQDAPELLPATEDLRKLVHDEDFMDQKSHDTFDDYLDEAQVAPEGRTPGQWDSIQEFVDDHREGMNDSQYEKVSEAIAKARAEALDTPDTSDKDSFFPANWNHDYKPGDKDFTYGDKPDYSQDGPPPEANAPQEDAPSGEPDAKTVAGRLIAEFDASQRRGADWAVPQNAADPSESKQKEATELQQLLASKGIEAVAQELWKRYGNDNSGGMDWLSEWTRNKWIQLAKNIFEKGN
jgi:hypothetical protein